MTTPQPNPSSARSVPAIVTYLLFALWSITMLSVIRLIYLKLQVDQAVFAILGGMIGTEQTLLVAAVQFWVGTTAGAKASGDALVESNKTGAAALAQLAGAGPPPPSQPLNTTKETGDDVQPGNPQQDPSTGSPPPTGGPRQQSDTAHFS